MALSIKKALLDLLKLKPLDGTNYKHWSQKLLIFFEQLEVKYLLLSDVPEENNAFETPATFPDGIVQDKSMTADEATLEKFKKDNKMVRGIY